MGLIVCTTFEALEMVKKVVLDSPDLQKSCQVCSCVESVSPYPVCCALLAEHLLQANLNAVFPKERPLLIVDNSPEWSTTWQLMMYLPTFHIASRDGKEESDI